MANTLISEQLFKYAFQEGWRQPLTLRKNNKTSVGVWPPDKFCISTHHWKATATKANNKHTLFTPK